MNGIGLAHLGVGMIPGEPVGEATTWRNDGKGRDRPSRRHTKWGMTSPMNSSRLFFASSNVMSPVCSCSTK